jgi:15-cis-phytoene synthase
VIASLPRDAAHRQLFVPQQLLESHGSTIEEVFAGKETPKLRVVLDQLAGEARQHIATAVSLLAEVPASARPMFLPLALARRNLARLSRADRSLFLPPPTSRLRTLWTLWRASRSREFTT